MRIETTQDGKYNVYGLKLWSTGLFHGFGSPPEGDRFSEEDLDEMVRADREIGHRLRPRAYAGHPLNPMLKMLARPKGQVTNLRREGKWLLADLKNVDKTFWDKAVEDDARFSPDLKIGHVDPETGGRYPLSVVGLGVLGAVQPGNSLLPSLQDYQVHYYAADHRSYASSVAAGRVGVSLLDQLSPKRAALEGLRDLQRLTAQSN